MFGVHAPRDLESMPRSLKRFIHVQTPPKVDFYFILTHPVKQVTSIDSINLSQK